MRTLIRALAIRVVPPDWRETVRADLSEDVLERSGASAWPTLRYAAEAVRIGITLRARNLRRPDMIGAFASLERLPAEFHYAGRALRRAPWFTAAIVSVMTLVLTLATVVFAIADGVLFRPLPYPQADRLFAIEPGFEGLPRHEFLATTVSPADVANWSATAPGVGFSGFSVANVIGYGTGVNDDGGGMAEVRPDIFTVLGVHPMVGGFIDADFSSRSPITPVIITWDLWQGRFRGASDILGRVVYLDGSTTLGFRVVGVMPRGFWFPSDRAEVQFLAPKVLTTEQLTDPSRRTFTRVIARVPAGMTAEALRSRVEVGMRATAAVLPDPGPRPDGWSEAGWRRQGPYERASVTPLARSVGEQSRPLFLAVFAAVMVLVALGALNASGLMAARAVDRERELGVRRALGASRLAVGRTVAVESFALCLLAGALALPLSQPVLRFVLTLLPERTVVFKPWGAEAVDGRILAFVALLAAALAVQASIWPIRRAMTAAPGTGTVAGRASERRTLGRSVVVSTQVAGALALTVVGALLVGSLLSVYGQGLSIRAGNIVLVEAQMWGLRSGSAAERAARVSPILERLRALPAVRDAALMAGQALVGPVPRGIGWGYFDTPRRDLINAYTHAVTAGYYRILQPQVVAGRLPTEAELAGGVPIAVVSESLAAEYWPAESALGQVLKASRAGTTYEVVGVVRDVPWLSWDTEAPTAYGPYGPLAVRDSTITLFIEAAHDPARVTREVLRELEAMTPPVIARRSGELTDVFADTVRDRRFRAWLFGGFAASALIVVGIGILGLLAMATARRTKEVGIRQALGATRSSIVQLLVGEQLVPVFVGLATGAVVSAWAVGFVESYLFHVTTTDLRVWASAFALLLLTAGIGTLVPSLRASSSDPTTTLRAE